MVLLPQRFQKRFRRTAIRVLKKYTIHLYAFAALFAVGMIPAIIWVFPATTLIVVLLQLVFGGVSAIAALASVLVDLEQDDDIDDLADDGKLNRKKR